jgi:hypothetical protein
MRMLVANIVHVRSRTCHKHIKIPIIAIAKYWKRKCDSRSMKRTSEGKKEIVDKTNKTIVLTNIKYFKFFITNLILGLLVSEILL